MSLIDRGLVSIGLRDFLRSRVQFPVELVQQPEVLPQPIESIQSGHAIVIPLPSTRFLGPPLADPESVAAWQYQFSCVGRQPEQAEVLAHLLNDAVMARSPGGGFVHAIPVVGAVVIERELSEAGGFIPGTEEGGLYPVHSTLTITVEKA